MAGSKDGKGAGGDRRVFLVVVDRSEEMSVALRFAARRANSTGGRVAMLYVIEPADFGHWLAVDDLIGEERRQEAEDLMHSMSGQVMAITEEVPIVHIREGKVREELLELLEEEPGISVLVLASSSGPKGPGPLISALTGKLWSRLHIPLTIVPGNLADDEVDALT